VLGGFTTFSAFALDTVLMAERHDVTTGLVYVAASVLLSLAAVVSGMWLVRVPLA
jgi:CrcB protein